MRKVSTFFPSLLKSALGNLSGRSRTVAVEKLYKPGFGYKRIGVWATKVKPEDCVQGHIWVSPDLEKKPKLLKIMDQINVESLCPPTCCEPTRRAVSIGSTNRLRRLVRPPATLDEATSRGQSLGRAGSKGEPAAGQGSMNFIALGLSPMPNLQGEA